MAMYVGVTGTPKEISSLYVGVNGVPKEVNEVYAGDNGSGNGTGGENLQVRYPFQEIGSHPLGHCPGLLPSHIVRHSGET